MWSTNGRAKPRSNMAPGAMASSGHSSGRQAAVNRSGISGCGLHHINARVQHRPITGAERSQRRRWGEHRIFTRYFYRALIAVHGPPELSATGENVSLPCCCDHAAVGQFVRRTPLGMQSLASMVEPLAVQDCVHLRGRRHLYRPAEGPCVTKCFCRFTPAEETRAVTCRECDRLVQKEQLCPTAASHDGAPPSSQRQVSQALLAQRLFSSVRVAGS